MTQTHRDPRRRHRRHTDRQPTAPPLPRRRRLAITVVDQDDRHVYQPGLLFVPFGLAHQRRHRPAPRTSSCTTASTSSSPRSTTSTSKPTPSSRRRRDARLRRAGRRHRCDAGARGDRGPHRAGLDARRCSPSTTSPAPPRWRRRWPTFDGGRLVVNVVDMPIKCPVAPLEFCFLADWYFTERGIRDQVEIIYVTPLDGAFTKPIASATLGGLLDEKGIQLVTEFNTGEVDGAGGRLVGYDGREVPFDLAVVVPLHSGADYVGRCAGLGDDSNFVPDRQAHPAVAGKAEHLRHRRRHQRARLEGRIGDPLRGRGARREHRPLPRRRDRSSDASTGTPTASSRPDSARRC